MTFDFITYLVFKIIAVSPAAVQSELTTGGMRGNCQDSLYKRVILQMVTTGHFSVVTLSG